MRGITAGARDRGRVGLQRDKCRGARRTASSTPSRRSSSGTVTKSAGSPSCIERGDGRVDMGVGGFVEVLGAHLLDDDCYGVARQQHRAEHGLLGIEVVGRNPRAPGARDRRGRIPRLAGAATRPGTGCKATITTTRIADGAWGR